MTARSVSLSSVESELFDDPEEVGAAAREHYGKFDATLDPGSLANPAPERKSPLKDSYTFGDEPKTAAELAEEKAAGLAQPSPGDVHTLLERARRDALLKNARPVEDYGEEEVPPPCTSRWENMPLEVSSPKAAQTLRYAERAPQERPVLYQLRGDVGLLRMTVLFIITQSQDFADLEETTFAPGWHLVPLAPVTDLQATLKLCGVTFRKNPRY